MMTKLVMVIISILAISVADADQQKTQKNSMTAAQEHTRNEALWKHYDWDKYPGRFTGFTMNLQQIAVLNLKPAIRIQVGPPGCYKGCMVLMPNGDLIATPMNPDRKGGYKSLVYRSTDKGLTWKKIAEPNDLPGKEHALTALSDGTLLLFDELGYFSRSQDGGKTWKIKYTLLNYNQTDTKNSFTRNIEELPDGSLRLFAARDENEPNGVSQLFLYTSKDRGYTWKCQRVSVDSGNPPIFKDWAPHGSKEIRVMAFEPDWVTLPNDKLLFIWRGEQSRIIDNYTPPFLYGDYTETGDHMLITESTDNGQTWSKATSFTNYGEVHGDLTLLDDGRVMCTYANYHLPYGIFAIFSYDLGKTWDKDHPIQLALSANEYCGWPTTIQLPDSTMITSYATQAYLKRVTPSNPNGGAAFQIVKWQLPPKRN